MPAVPANAAAVERTFLDRLYDRLNPPRRLRFTREGWYYFFFTLGVGTAALNTGNNLLFLVLGLQLTAIVVSGILSEIALQRLVIRRVLPKEPCAGEPMTLTYEVQNRKRFWPSLTLFVCEKRPPFRDARALVLSVAAGKATHCAVDVPAPRRGLYRLDALTVVTRFPFGFFEKERDLAVADELLVLPARVRAKERRAQGGYRDGEKPEGRAGNGAEFLGLRELRPGDDRRRVHWRKSASAGRLLAVERERERKRRVVLCLDNRGRDDDGAWLEPHVEEAAALARLLSQRGLEVGLATSGEHLPPESGPAALRRLLRRLAVLDAVADGPAPDPRREGVIDVRCARSAA